jgi:endonuclease/exonuclease/phosphatase family metal-dependent hydrolase
LTLALNNERFYSSGVKRDPVNIWPLAVLLALVLTRPDSRSDTFSIATYNLENYLDAPAGTRPLKSNESKAKIRETIRAMRPDVLALQEVGTTNALLELRASLKAEGLEFPFWIHVAGFDTNIHVALLSRFPVINNRSHSAEGFLLRGRRFRMSRGIAELDLQPRPAYQFTLFIAHLKSRRPSPDADEADMREQEALILREKIEARLKRDPKANIAVVGDLNDVKNSPSTRVILGRRNSAVGLIDTRPAERNGDIEPAANARFSARNITWTHFYGAEDSYSRIDYILLSHGMAREWQPAGTYIVSVPNWGVGSDHRPIIAQFEAHDQ